jgi:hypothetical protein
VYRETVLEGPRHVFDPAINASSLHWMAVAPRAVAEARFRMVLTMAEQH